MVTSPTYQLSDEQWEKIEDFFPKNGNRGGQWNPHRPMVDAKISRETMKVRYESIT